MLREKEVKDPIDELVDSLNPSDYGGVYFDKDGTLHITITNDSVKSKVAGFKSTNDIKIIFNPVQWSWRDLTDARDLLFSKHNELHIQGVGLNPEKNSLVIFSSKLTEDEKQAIIDMSPVKNIEFTEHTFRYADPQCETNPDSIEENKNLRASTLYGNYTVSNTLNGVWSTLGYAVTYYPRGSVEGQKAYITCGHGFVNNVGSNVYVGPGLGSAVLGKILVKDYANHTPLDVLIVSGSQPWGGIPRNNSNIKASGGLSPQVGKNIYFNGRTSGQHTGTIQTIGISMVLEDKTHEETNYYTGLFIFDCLPEAGDSGAAVLTENSNGTYKMTGLIVGQAEEDGTGEFNWGCGSPWSRIKAVYDMDLRNS